MGKLGDAVVFALSSKPVPIEFSEGPSSAGGLPSEPGFYAWWAARDSLVIIPCAPHPANHGTCLLYVGIAPRDARSTARVRSRVLSQHVRGNTASSTFRYALASLLLEVLTLRPFKRGKKYLLPPDDNDRLHTWMCEHLSLTWCSRSDPWIYEAGVIEAMRPPLNLAEKHPLYFHMKAARARFRGAADARA